MNSFLVLVLMVSFGVCASEKVSFNFEIRPILADKCFSCHGPDGQNRQGKVRLDTAEGLFKVAKKGRTPIVKGHPAKSTVWKRITTKDEDDVMPPPETHLSLSEPEKSLIRKWIEQGAEYEEHWSFRPLPEKVVLAQVADGQGNVVDFFIRAKLLSKGLTAAAAASKEILLRRVSFVLTGLPPSVAEVKSFVEDEAPDAYERVVDRLLESKACAERLAVDWMDVSRFADTYGFQVDRDRDMTAWRDWVLKAFDSNMPYDRFVTWQLAGDMIPTPSRESILATAFNRNHQQKTEGGSIEEEFRVEYVADRTHTAGTAFLGLTFECARCHDHKYDPISTRDYYSLFAFFNNIDEAGLYSFFSTATPSPTLTLSKAQEERKISQLRSAVEQKKTELLKIEESEKEAFRKWRLTKKASCGGDESARYEFDAVDEALKNKRQDKYHGSGKVAIVHDQYRKAIKLDGDSEIHFKNLGVYNRAHPISISMTIKIPESNDRAVLIHRSKAWTDAASRGWEVLMEQGRVSWAFIHFWPGNAIRVKTMKEAPLNKWFNLTVTYDGSSEASGLKIYFDGVLQKCEVVRDALTKEIHYGKVNIPVTLGARMRDRGFKNGLVDELSFYERELSQGEIRLLNKMTVDETELYRLYLHKYSEVYKKKQQELQQARVLLNNEMNALTEIMVMKEQSVKRKTYVLKRGLYDSPDLEQEVLGGVPEGIFAYPEDLPRNRLGLAKWLTLPEHPLTARVAVNRFWQMIFGQGIVSTPDDFGSQGALPTHPKLLDWLAREFIDSGWNVKHMLKLMVMSATFKQSSLASAEKVDADSDNSYLSRGPRYRLTAEMIRDMALLAAGSLDRKFGGRSEDPSHSQRRSLYLYWKRNDPPADMLIFDAPRRQVCSVKREVTSTPLQALALLNKGLYWQASKALANRALESTKGDESGSLKEIFMSLTSRWPDDKESRILMGILEEQREYFKANPESVKACFREDQPALSWPDRRELAAWSVVTNMVLNMDSSIILR